MNEDRNGPKDGAARQEAWKKRQRKQGRSRRFDKQVTPEEYDELAAMLKRLRET